MHQPELRDLIARHYRPATENDQLAALAMDRETLEAAYLRELGLRGAYHCALGEVRAELAESEDAADLLQLQATTQWLKTVNTARHAKRLQNALDAERALPRRTRRSWTAALTPWPVWAQVAAALPIGAALIALVASV